MPELKPRSIRPEQSGSEKKSITDAKRNVRERSGRKLKSAQNSVSSSRLAELEEQAYLDNCTAREKIQEKASCKLRK